MKKVHIKAEIDIVKFEREDTMNIASVSTQGLLKRLTIVHLCSRLPPHMI